MRVEVSEIGDSFLYENEFPGIMPRTIFLQETIPSRHKGEVGFLISSVDSFWEGVLKVVSKGEKPPRVLEFPVKDHDIKKHLIILDDGRD